MKEYNRTTKKYEEKSEVVGSLKKKETCRGGKPHDFLIVLPEFISMRNRDIDTATENVIKYYESEDRIHDFIQKEVEFKKSLGIHIGVSGWKSKITRYFRCSVCGKKDCEY